MLVVTKKAEEKFLKELQKYKESNPAQICFYVAGSSLGNARDDFRSIFLTLLEKMPNAYQMQVFICQDDDVFMFVQAFMQRQFSEFIKALADQVENDELIHQTKIYKVNVDYKTLHDLCAEKIPDIKENQTLGMTKTDIEISKTLEDIEIDLLKSIQQRRQQRQDSHIFIVDDDQLSRTLIDNALNKNFRLSFAENGHKAIVDYVSCAPDVLFLDIGLPDVSGHDVLETIFQIDPQAYVIMFSGRRDKENILRALDAGAQGFVGKPFTRDKLFQYIQKSPHLSNKFLKVPMIDEGTRVVRGHSES